MDVMPLVPETKMADARKQSVREPVGQENHVVSAYVRSFNFVPRIWSLLHDKNSL